MTWRVGFLWLLLGTTGACGGGPPEAAPLDTRSEQCAWCQMMVSDPRTAAQIVAPGENPRFFDDLGCLSAWIGRHGMPADRAHAFVADHRTKAWVPADLAIYTRVESLETPMGSHLVGHADTASRNADPDARCGDAVPVAEILGTTVGGRR